MAPRNTVFVVLAGDKAPEQEDGRLETMKTFIFQVCYMEGRLYSNKALNADVLRYPWGQV